MQHGGFVPANPPFGTLRRLGEREGEFVVPASRMAASPAAAAGPVSVTFQINVDGNVIGTKEQLLRTIAPALERDCGFAEGREGGAQGSKSVSDTNGGTGPKAVQATRPRRVLRPAFF